MSIYVHCIDGKCALVIPQMFSPMQVRARSTTPCTLAHADSSKVADASVMLALMAGRNAGAGVTLVKEGKVKPNSIIPHNTIFSRLSP